MLQNSKFALDILGLVWYLLLIPEFNQVSLNGALVLEVLGATTLNKTTLSRVQCDGLFTVYNVSVRIRFGSLFVMLFW